MNVDYLKRDAEVAAKWAQRAIGAVKTCILFAPEIKQDLQDVGLGNFDIIITHFNVIFIYKRWLDVSELSFKIALHPKAKVEDILDNTINFYIDEEGKERHVPIYYANKFVDDCQFLLPGGIETPSGPMQRMYPGCAIFMRVGRISRPPEEFIVSTVNSLTISRNLRIGSKANPSFSGQDSLLAFKNIITEFKGLLNSSKKEEDIQVFIKQNPIMVYPDFLNIWPKLALGSEYETDFVFENRAYLGTEHVFVEIESAKKKLFTKSGQPSSEYTQAKNQIADWKIWIEDNHAYLRKKLLIMGRAIESPDLRRKIRSDAGALMRFSTYDDLAQKAEQLLERLAAYRT